MKQFRVESLEFRGQRLVESLEFRDVDSISKLSSLNSTLKTKLSKLFLLLPITFFSFTLLHAEQILVANHVHTKYTKHDSKLYFLKRSPGEILDEMERICVRLGVRGAVIFQDHNSLEILEDAGFSPRPHVIPIAGVEWGEDHHLGIINITSLKGLPREEGPESLERIIRWVHQKRPLACVIINHPMKEADGWPDENPRGADAIEVWATPFFRDLPFLKKNHNKKATAWHSVLNEQMKVKRKVRGKKFIVKEGGGCDRTSVNCSLVLPRTKFASGEIGRGMAGYGEEKKITAMGGSDFHFDIPFLNGLVRPANWIDVKVFSADEVVRAIKAGRVEITASPKVRPGKKR